jgi:hypothetical protein
MLLHLSGVMQLILSLASIASMLNHFIFDELKKAIQTPNQWWAAMALSASFLPLVIFVVCCAGTGKGKGAVEEEECADSKVYKSDAFEPLLSAHHHSHESVVLLLYCRSIVQLHGT